MEYFQSQDVSVAFWSSKAADEDSLIGKENWQSEESEEEISDERLPEFNRKRLVNEQSDEEDISEEDDEDSHENKGLNKGSALVCEGSGSVCRVSSEGSSEEDYGNNKDADEALNRLKLVVLEERLSKKTNHDDSDDSDDIVEPRDMCSHVAVADEKSKTEHDHHERDTDEKGGLEPEEQDDSHLLSSEELLSFFRGLCPSYQPVRSK